MSAGAGSDRASRQKVMFAFTSLINIEKDDLVAVVDMDPVVVKEACAAMFCVTLCSCGTKDSRKPCVQSPLDDITIFEDRGREDWVYMACE